MDTQTLNGLGVLAEGFTQELPDYNAWLDSLEATLPPRP